MHSKYSPQMSKDTEHKSLVICLMGPTASGKTQLAIELLQKLPCEIISVDSAMVYRQMDIGTAKPDRATLIAAPHRLIDIRDPSEPYSVGDFYRDALDAIQAILSRDRIPLLIGGSMLYFHALQKGIANLPKANPSVRAHLMSELQQNGLEKLYQRLMKIDEQTAATIHAHDQQRILRMLEIFESSGKKPSELFLKTAREETPYFFINVAIAPQQRSSLHANIEDRFKRMLATGFIEEVEALFKRGDLNPDLPALRAVGYRQVWDYLEQRSTYETMREKGIIASRQLAKRQFTWLRNWPAHWLDSEEEGKADKLCKLVGAYSISLL